MDEDRSALPAGGSGTGRRGVLKSMMTLGAVGAVLSGSPASASASAAAGAAPRGLTPRQLAGQRVIYSYPGRTVPAAC